MKTFSINSFYETENTDKNFEESLFESIWERLGDEHTFQKEFIYPASAQECEKTSRGKLNEKAGHSDCQGFSRNSSRFSSPLTWDTPSPSPSDCGGNNQIHSANHTQVASPAVLPSSEVHSAEHAPLVSRRTTSPCTPVPSPSPSSSPWQHCTCQTWI